MKLQTFSEDIKPRFQVPNQSPSHLDISPSYGIKTILSARRRMAYDI
jgi:hypothetical protein